MKFLTFLKERKSSHSVVSNSLRPKGMYVAHQAPPSMESPSQEYWSGLPFPSPGDLPNLWTEPMSPALAGIFFTSQSPGKPLSKYKEL